MNIKRSGQDSRMSMLGLAMAAAVFTGCAIAASAQPAEKPATPPAPPAPTVQPGAAQPATPPAPPAPAQAAEKLEYVKMKTSMGDIVIELDREHAPISVENFLKYVEKGYYEGTIFHRVMDGFMIQGGGFTTDMKEKGGTDKPIKNEWKNGLKNKKGTIAMARTSVPDSATSQFYINVVDNAGLDRPQGGAAYAVFGHVVGGMDVVDKIRVVATKVVGPHEAVPTTPITIDKVTKITKEEAMPSGGAK